MCLTGRSLLSQGKYALCLVAITLASVSGVLGQSINITALSGFKQFVGAGNGGLYTNAQIKVGLSGDFTTTPVTLSVPNAPAGLTAYFSTNGFTNSQGVVFVQLAVTNVAKGVYPLTIAATNSSGTVGNATNLLLVAGAAWVSTGTDTNWSTAGNWSTGTVPGANDDVMFQDAGWGTNYLTGSLSVASLTFIRNLNALSNNVALADGVTLSVLGTNGMSLNVDSTTSPASGKTMVVSVAGGGGATLLVSNASANVLINGDSTGNVGTSLILTNLDNYKAYVNRIGIADVAMTTLGAVGAQMVTPSFAKTNVFYAGYVGDYTTTNPILYAISMANNTETYNNGSAYTISLGLRNAIQADSIGAGQARAGSGSSILRFNPGFLSAIPYASFRNTNGGRMSLVAIAVDSGVRYTGGNSKFKFDFTGGYVDMLVDTMWIGRNRYTNSSAATQVGNLTFNYGVVDVNTLRLGYQAYTNDSFGNGTVAVGGWTNAALLTVNTDLNLGFTTGDYSSGVNASRAYGQIVINTNGIVRANQVTVGQLSTNNAITVANGGLLDVSNQVAGSTGYLTSLTLNGGAGKGAGINLHLNGNNTLIYVTNLATTASGNFLNIASIAGISSYPVTIPVIKYVNGASAGFSAGSVNVGITGLNATFVNNTANGTIDLTLTLGAPKNLVWKGTVNNQWDTFSKNWLDMSTLVMTNFSTGDNVVFDDSASQYTVAVAENVTPGQSSLVNGIRMSNTTAAYVIGGSANILGSASFVKYGTNSFRLDSYAESALSIHQGAVTVNGTFGAVSVATGGKLVNNGTIIGSLQSAGMATNSGTVNAGLSVLAGGTVYNFATSHGTLSMDPGSFLNNLGTIDGIGSPTISSNAVLANSGTILGYNLNVSGTLKDSGAGYIGMVSTLTINSGGTYIPGGDGIGTSIVRETSVYDPISAGTVKFYTGSTNVFKVDPGATSQNCTKVLSYLDLLGPSQATVQTNGGTIVITNVGSTAFAVGQTFKILGMYPSDGVFSPSLFSLNTTNSYPVISPARPGPGMAWDLSQVIFNGTIGIVTNTMPDNPTNLTFSVSGNVVTLSWPVEYTGWLLQMQTNSLSTGLGTNWTLVAGSAATNQMYFTNDPAIPAVFFRMAHP